MEPDIIRMYSSSPPPLDNGAEDDEEDEFGEFGGFSEVSPSGVGFVDFDTPDYTRPKEDFVPSNHFMPIHEYSEDVDSLTSFKSVQNGNDKDITAELSTPVKSQSDVEEEVSSLKHLLETHSSPAKTREALADRGELRGVWTELQDIHDAHGLRYQWGGSHSNKKLLCSLGIDTRNILFTGNKKQPVIVPMYAAGLGMLEPTKEPLKPLSAAEKIASIGQTTVMTPEINTCTSDPFQESLPPVQFDWSSSGLTNPLDGVDPELYELTTAKLETSTSSLRVTDAFAKLMSTVHAQGF